MASVNGAAATTFTPAPNLTFQFTPITREAYFSTWSTTDLKGLTALRTEARFIWFGDDPQWAPGYKIAFDAGEQHVMLSVAARRDGRLSVEFEDYQGDKLVRRDAFAAAPGARTPLEIQLYWTAEGEVTASIGAQGGSDFETRAVKLRSRLEKLSILVSTAGVAFDPVVLGAGQP